MDIQEIALIQYCKRAPELLESRQQALFLECCPATLANLYPRLQFHGFSWDKVTNSLLASHGLSTQEREDFDVIIVMGRRNFTENLFLSAYALGRLRPLGLLLVSIANDRGAKRFEGKLTEVGEILPTFSKSHGRVVGIRASDGLNQELLASWLELENPRPVDGAPLVSSPFAFSAGEIDYGSRLLAEYLPTSLQGHGADFGSGYGYLAWSALKQNPNIMALDLFDTDRRSLALAEKNLAPVAANCRTSFCWLDLTKDAPVSTYDWIIMNPPFHTSDGQAVDLGLSFLDAAALALKPKGRLFFVHNTHLPYREKLRERFSHFSVLKESEGFRVIEAQQ